MGPLPSSCFIRGLRCPIFDLVVRVAMGEFQSDPKKVFQALNLATNIKMGPLSHLELFCDPF